MVHLLFQLNKTLIPVTFYPKFLICIAIQLPLMVLSVKEERMAPG